MNDLLKTMSIVVLSIIATNKLLSQLYIRNPKKFPIIDKIPKIWKEKWFVKWGIILILITIISGFVTVIGLNETVGTIIIGFFISFIEFIFKNPENN